MKEEWKEYYMYLERLRKSGGTNMYGAAPYLIVHFGLSSDEASDILYNWMNNYSEIAEKFYK